MNITAYGITAFPPLTNGFFSTLLGAINRTAFRVFGWPVQWYGIILTTGMVVAFFYLLHQFKKKNIISDYAYEIFIYAVVAAVIGARLVYVFARFDDPAFFPVENWDDFVNLIAIWDGGITVIGAIIFGFASLWLCSKINKQPFIATVDLVAPCMLIGQIIGRWGNFVNQEAFGLLITNPNWQWFPFAVQIGNSWHCATFFYEMVLNIVGLCIMVRISKNCRRGIPTCFYFVWYGVVRTCMEFVRTDAVIKEWGGVDVRITALLCTLFAIGGCVLIALLHKGIIRVDDSPFSLDKQPTGEEHLIDEEVKDYLERNG